MLAGWLAGWLAGLLACCLAAAICLRWLLLLCVYRAAIGTSRNAASSSVASTLTTHCHLAEALVEASNLMAVHP